MELQNRIEVDLDQAGKWIAAHYPEESRPLARIRLRQTATNTAEIYWWDPELGDPPTAEDIASWQPPAPPLKQLVRAQLDPDEADRRELLRDLRGEAMAALIANGWTAEQAQAAGQEFIRDYSADLFAFEFGAHRAFFAAVAVDQRSWLSLPWPGHPSLTIRDIFAQV